MFVATALRNVCRGVTRLSPSCYAQFLDYLHHAYKAWVTRYARSPLRKERTPGKWIPIVTSQEGH
jgi:hypothetical protein